MRKKLIILKRLKQRQKSYQRRCRKSVPNFIKLIRKPKVLTKEVPKVLTKEVPEVLRRDHPTNGQRKVNLRKNKKTGNQLSDARYARCRAMNVSNSWRVIPISPAHSSQA